MDALRDRETVYSADLRAEPRWPSWGPRVVDELGVRSVLSFRLFTARDTLGALNLFSRTADAFDDNTADRAFEVLVRLSSHQNVKLHQVARELVATRKVPRAGARAHLT